MQKWIAEEKFTCAPKSGKRFTVVARIGEPVAMPAEGDLSAYGRCPVSLEPLIPLRRIHGANQFQALCLAIDYIRRVLKAFVAEGGRVYYPGTGNLIDLDSTSFLPMESLKDFNVRARRTPNK